MPPGRRLARWAGGLSMGAGAVHGGLAHAHFDEWWGYGLFFVFAAIAQILLGLALLTDAINPVDSGPSWRRLERIAYVAGIVGNAAIVALYVVTRTVGIPFFGPEAGAVEEVAALDVVSKLLEVATIVLLARLIARR